jgi:hypothetical protein
MRAMARVGSRGFGRRRGFGNESLTQISAMAVCRSRPLVTAGSRGWGDASMLTTLVTRLAFFALGLANALLILLVIGAIADKMVEAL